MIDLSAGQLVAERYRVDHVIGAGGMGVVLAATHLDLRQPVAIKVLRDANAEAIARFQREARLIVRLKSVHVARVFDVGTLDDGTPFYVMELLEGEDLSRVVAKRGRLPVEQAVDYVLEACEAIAEAHTLGVVHRDLKPANLFVARGAGGRGSVKVLDFGVSKMVADGPEAGQLTNEGVALGSPGYMAPEQIASSRDVDARADIYSLGAILYRLTSGKNPYEGESLMSVLASMAATPLVPLSSIADVPAEFARIVERCLAQEPEARFGSVAELANALAHFGTRRAKASLEEILAMMGVDEGGETSTVPQPPPDPRGRPASAPSEPSIVEEDIETEALATIPRDPPLAPTVVGAPRPLSTARIRSTPRAASSTNASLLPLGLAILFLVAIVAWVVASRRSRPPPTLAPVPSAAAPETIATAAIPPAPAPVAPPVPAPAAEPAPEPSSLVHPRAKPPPRPAPAPAPKRR